MKLYASLISAFLIAAVHSAATPEDSTLPYCDELDLPMTTTASGAYPTSAPSPSESVLPKPVDPALVNGGAPGAMLSMTAFAGLLGWALM